MQPDWMMGLKAISVGCNLFSGGARMVLKVVGANQAAQGKAE
jgi:hypothetical protein